MITLHDIYNEALDNHQRTFLITLINYIVSNSLKKDQIKKFCEQKRKSNLVGKFPSKYSNCTHI